MCKSKQNMNMCKYCTAWIVLISGVTARLSTDTVTICVEMPTSDHWDTSYILQTGEAYIPHTQPWSQQIDKTRNQSIGIFGFSTAKTQILLNV